MKDYILIRPVDVNVDPEVQRTLDMTHVNKLAKKPYDPLLFGLGHVSMRRDGRYYCLDGQHRCEAAKASGFGEVAVLFKVYEGLSVQHEAQLFRDLNGLKKSVNAYEDFRMAVKANHPEHLKIVETLRQYGLEVTPSQKTGGVSAVVALIRIFHGKIGAYGGKRTVAHGPRLLSRTLGVLTSAWGAERSAFDGILLLGVSAFLSKYGDTIDENRLAKNVSKKGTATMTIGRIRGLQSVSNLTPIAAAVQILEGLYDHGRVRRLSGA